MSNVEMVEVDRLLLDPENPRLPLDMQNKSQKQIVAYIAKHETVEDLMSAIGHNGFFEGEPLVVYRNPDDAKGKLRVIEGNRRLTSVMLLRNPDLYSDRPSLREIARESPKRNIPDMVPVVSVASREDALPYLGSRHIVGVKEWEPLQKARYMYQLFGSTKKTLTPAERYKSVAARIGSGKRSDYIKKNLDALAVYTVMSDAEFYGDANVDENSFSFGVLYTALDAKAIAGYIGAVDYDAANDVVKKRNDPITTPSVLKKAAVQDLYRWCFHRNDEGETVLGESRNIPKLAAVLRDKKSIKILNDTGSLQLAYERSGGVDQELLVAVSKALKQLRYGNSIVANVQTPGEAVDVSKQVSQQARQLHQALVSKAEEE